MFILSSISSKTSGLKAFSNSFTTCETAFTISLFKNCFFSLSVICLSKRVNLLAREVNNSSSLAPTATACNKSFNGTPGFFSNGRLSVFKLFVTPIASIITKWSLVSLAVGVTFLNRQPDGPCAPAFHLLKIVLAFHITHEKQTFQRLHICTCGNHINCHSNSRIIVIAKLCKSAFRVFACISYFFTEFIFLSKLFSHNVNYIICMTVSFSKYKGLWYFKVSVFIKSFL